MTSPGFSATAAAPELSVRSVPVAENLALFHGVWLDSVAAFHPDGTPMTVESAGGPATDDSATDADSQARTFPYQQLVYLDFDGERLTQTNVVVRGRAPHARTFRAQVVDGVLRFDPAGLQATTTIGVSGGPGVLVFLPERVDTDSHRRFADPDYIRHLGGDQRTRTTTLYRDGELTRVLTVSGTRVAADPSLRLPWDPRGPVGDVHEPAPTENPRRTT